MTWWNACWSSMADAAPAKQGNAMPFLSEITMVAMGWVVGLLIAMPVGPVAALSIKRTLHRGWPVGAATGLGAATADSIYAAIAAFGVYAVQEFLIQHQYTLRVFGGLALLFVGFRMFWQKAQINTAAPDDTDDPDAWHRLLHGFASGLIITLTNPLTLIAFLTIFTNFGLTQDMHSYKVALAFVVGAFLGAASWWLSLVGIITLIKARISDLLMTRINGFLAIFLILAGTYAIITGIFEQPLGEVLQH